jgi:hypothetical protein
MATDDDVSETTKQVLRELDPGTVIDDMVLLSRRQVIGLATGTLSLGALATWGAGDAAAQSVGSIGTSSERVDVFAQSLDVAGTFSPSAIDTSGTVSAADVDASNNITASGTVSAADVDATNGVTGTTVTGDTLTATTEFVDASGTSHSGTVADASDLGESQNVSGGYDLTIDGDTYEFRQ